MKLGRFGREMGSLRARTALSLVALVALLAVAYRLEYIAVGDGFADAGVEIHRFGRRTFQAVTSRRSVQLQAEQKEQRQVQVQVEFSGMGKEAGDKSDILFGANKREGARVNQIQNQNQNQNQFGAQPRDELYLTSSGIRVAKVISSRGSRGKKNYTNSQGAQDDIDMIAVLRNIAKDATSGMSTSATTARGGVVSVQRPSDWDSLLNGSFVESDLGRGGEVVLRESVTQIDGMDQEDQDDEEDYGNPDNGDALQPSERIRVALFNGAGVALRSWKNVRGVLKCARSHFKVRMIDDLNKVSKKEFDVLIIPGGLAATIRGPYKKNFGELKRKIKKFLMDGGGYVGICAGAFLAGFFTINPFTTAYINLGVGYFTSSEWHLPQPSLQHVNNSSLGIPLSSKDSTKQRIYYAQGPVFRRPKVIDPKQTAVRNPTVLLSVGPTAKLQVHTSTAGRLKSSSNTFQKLPLVVAADYGKLGRIVLSATHQETDVNGSTNRKMDIGGPSKCNSFQAKVLLNMIYYSARVF